MINILLPVAKVMPSIDCPVVNAVAKFPLTVVATLTEAFTSNPLAILSTYDFVAASDLLVGSDNPKRTRPDNVAVPSVNDPPVTAPLAETVVAPEIGPALVIPPLELSNEFVKVTPLSSTLNPSANIFFVYILFH